ncbi:ABC-2 type transporter family protein, partial [Prunus dulcis]
EREGNTLIIYVDDMIITENDKRKISQLQDYLATDGSIAARHISLSKEICLGLVDRHRNARLQTCGHSIVQNHHLGEYPKFQLTKKDTKVSGKIDLFVTYSTRHCLCAVSVVNHINAVLRILRYLKSAPGKGLMFSKHGHLNIDGYSDADWAGNVTDIKSTSGYFTFMGGNLVTWRSKKQNVVALSSAEAEFRGMTKGFVNFFGKKVAY